MKKSIICANFIIIFVLLAFSSYLKSKEQAEMIAQECPLAVSPMRGQLILFMNGDFKPCWMFRGEYKEQITGATFDVYVSIFTKVLIVHGKEERSSDKAKRNPGH